MTRKDREQTIADLTAEGWPLAAIRSVLRDAVTLTRLAEMACSSEAADRDRVPCPAGPDWTGVKGLPCLCDHRDEAHETVPRIAVQANRTERRVHTLAARMGATVKFNGDPRGYVVKLTLPSGRYNTWGGKGEGYGIG